MGFGPRTWRIYRQLAAALGLSLGALGAPADVLRLGVQDAAVPFAYRTADGQAVGYTVHICQLIAERLARERGRPVELQYVSVTSKTRLVMLLAGETDLDCGSTSATEARRLLGLEFSRPVFVSDAAVLLPRDAGAPESAAQWLRLAAQAPLPVVTTSGSTSVRHLAALRDQSPGGQALRVEYGVDHDDSMRRLLDGRASAFVMDRVLLAARLAWATAGSGRGRAGWEITPWSVAPLSLECYAVAMRERDTELKRVADATIGELLQGGAFDALYARWFQQPIAPPKAVVDLQGQAAARPLDLPLPAGLRERLADPGGAACASGRANAGAPR
jgi:glutamate/aspartate transport system substrate-binding protein